MVFSCRVTEIATFKVRECYIKFPVTMPPSKGFLHTMCERVRGKGQSGFHINPESCYLTLYSEGETRSLTDSLMSVY